MSNYNPIHVLNKSLALLQIEGGFRTSTDSVLLGAACPIKAGQHVLDLGCGVGSAGLCVLKRVAYTNLTGLDIQADHIAIASQNAALNTMSGRASFHCGDVRDTHDIGMFDHVICNPPYKESGAHIPSPSNKKALAMGHQEEDLSLQDWITCAWTHIKGQGSLCMIHEATKTDEIIHNLYSLKGGRRFGNIEIFPIFSKKGDEANRVVIRAWKHKKAGSKIYSGIIMHDAEGAYTKEAEDILRHSASLIE
ncbi:MAG: tRNA1(Val) (adenine(37)-N6)-methyltransferase [Alphaproteobacteria bacterium]